MEIFCISAKHHEIGPKKKNNVRGEKTRFQFIKCPTGRRKAGTRLAWSGSSPAMCYRVEFRCVFRSRLKRAGSGWSVPSGGLTAGVPAQVGRPALVLLLVGRQSAPSWRAGRPSSWSRTDPHAERGHWEGKVTRLEGLRVNMATAPQVFRGTQPRGGALPSAVCARVCECVSTYLATYPCMFVFAETWGPGGGRGASPPVPGPGAAL